MAAANQAAAVLGGFLSGISSGGLGESLRDMGLSDLIGKSTSEVMRGFSNYLIGSTSLLDDGLVWEAFQDFQEEVAEQCETYEELDAALSRTTLLDSIDETLKRFFGFFIFRKFHRDFGERLLKACGTKQAARRTLQTVRDYIFEKLSQLTHGKDFGQVNWRGHEGVELAQQIQEKAWRIFGEG